MRLITYREPDVPGGTGPDRSDARLAGAPAGV